MNWPSQVIVYTDGASRGNPGPASIGVHITDKNGKSIQEISEYLGEGTNNFAEYSAVIKALELSIEHKVSNILIRSDSELLVKQLNGEYKVKSKSIIGLYKKVKELLLKIEHYGFEHVRRENNTKADSLANMALDER